MKQYSSYKDSGIAWIGQIPSHWVIKGLRSYLTLISDKGHGDKKLLSVTREQGVIVRNTDSKEENHNFIPDDLNGYKLVKKGQFAINKMKSWQGSYGVSEYEGIVSPAYFVCDLTFPYKPFFSMAIRSKAYIPFFTQYSKGIRVDQWDLSPLALKSIPFIEPPVDEQEAIVRFISEKSEKIDRYIAEQERLLSALDELRQAEIARSVTRGLNPDAPLRDSGIQWIGLIPQHWEKNKISRLAKGIGSGTTPRGEEFYNNGTIPWINSGDLNYGYLYSVQKQVTQKAINEIGALKIYPIDTILIAMYGASIGKISISKIEGCTNQACCALYDLSHDWNLKFAFYSLMACKQKWIEDSFGGTQPNISADKIKRTWLPIPPLSEQRAIVEYLDEKTAKIDRMKADIEKQIGLLKEYKQRMISDAVTGKIDVRE